MVKWKCFGSLVYPVVATLILCACQSGTEKKGEVVPTEMEEVKKTPSPEEMQKFFKVDSASRQKRIDARMERRAKRDSLLKNN